MPFNFITPVTETISTREDKEVKAIQITNMYMRLTKTRMDVTYLKGYDDGQGGVMWGAEEYSVSYRDDVNVGLTEYTDLVGRNTTTYSDVKTALYNEISSTLGINGSIA